MFDSETLEKIIEIVEASQEDICVGKDTWGEPDFISVINASTFLELLKKEVEKGENSIDREQDL